jgi:hypothetical protein
MVRHTADRKKVPRTAAAEWLKLDSGGRFPDTTASTSSRPAFNLEGKSGETTGATGLEPATSGVTGGSTERWLPCLAA